MSSRRRRGSRRFARAWRRISIRPVKSSLCLPQFPIAKTDRRGMVGQMPAKPRDTETPPAETPHYHGHRERLRERFYNAGPDAVSDYELLEMALFPALPRRDTKPLAKALLKK